MKVLITGTTRGIGKATAERFEQEGHEVISLVRDCAKTPLKGPYIVCDLADAKNVQKAIEEAGDVDVLVNNAGIVTYPHYDQYYGKEKEEILAVNLESPIRLMTECSKSMIKKKRGRIINVTSVAAHTGHPDIWYGMTKAALNNATKSFAKILGKHGIVVTAVAPGPVHTDLLEKLPKERVEMLKANTCNGKFSTPQEIAEVIYWLATAAPPTITGACIDVNNVAYPR